MRALIKVILFPITLVVSLGVILLRFLCHLSVMVLGPVAMLLSLLGIATCLLTGNLINGLVLLGLAFIIGPLGAPLILALLIECLGLLNDKLRTA